MLDGIIRSAKISPLEPANREASVRAALGMTSTEAENAFALSVVGTKGIDPVVIAHEKARTLKKNGLVEARQGLGDIGGLESLKSWLRSRANAFGNAARSYGLPVPKGLLIVGIPGTGKSLTAKATASAFGLPLLRLDMGKVFGGLVGQSEAILRSVIQTAEAIAPCVLWIDDIEKGFSDASGGDNNGGFSSLRTDALKMDLSGANGVVLRVMGDGRTYQLRFSTDAEYRGREMSFQAAFPTVKGEWTEAKVPFAKFRGTWRGIDLPDKVFDPAKISRVGLQLADKNPGPFELRVDWIRTYAE